MKRALALAALSFGCGAAPVWANENLKCLGTESYFGSLASLADGKKGPLALQKFSTTLPNGSYSQSGEPGFESQRLVSVSKDQQIPLADGTFKTGGLRMVAKLEYEDGRLAEFSQSLYEVGAGMISSTQNRYDWAGGHCRPSRIVVRDRRQLGDKRGVLFDAKLCELMRAEGVSAGAAEACVANAKKMLNVVKKYDQALLAATKGEEMLVSANPFVPGAIVPTANTIDNAVALNLMASCASYESAGADAKKTGRPVGKGAGAAAEPARDGAGNSAN